MYTLLVVDDEIKIRETLQDYLSEKGFRILLAQNGLEAISVEEENKIELIIMDVKMPVMDGLEACRKIREHSNVPILFLSAYGAEEKLLNGYLAGGDDYVVKPFPLSVLCEKCNVLIRRSKGIHSDNKKNIDGIIIDYEKMKIYIDSEDANGDCHISGIDFDLLSYLMENKNIVLKREKILNKLWGYDFVGDDRIVDTHIHRIRKKLGDKAYHIDTIVNTGYIFRG